MRSGCFSQPGLRTTTWTPTGRTAVTLPSGAVIETPYMDMKYHSSHGSMFETAPRPPNTPYIRGFATV